MRAIKFRAWYAPEKTMWDWNSMLSELSSWDKPFESTADWKVMQFTGLKDRDGRDIYEGDIVRMDSYETFVREVSYTQSGFTPFAETEFGNGILDEGRCEVIGNVHQNPELLTSLAKPE